MPHKIALHEDMKVRVIAQALSRVACNAKTALPPRKLVARAGRALLLLFTVFCITADADWPTYQHDNSRSGITSEELSPPLHEQWVFVSHAPQAAWPEPVKELPRVRFDEAYQVAASGDALYFGSSADNKVYCLDAETGEVRWSVFTEGPVRLAPTVWDNRVFFGSDDGCAYCLDADDGRTIWKFRGGFSDRRVLGNGKMISLWPIRTGVVVDDGIAYFAAGVFPAEDIFICAVKAADGTLVWRNDTCGERGPEQEFGGISPQGYLLASENKLYVPSGRAMPAAFDRSDGRFLYHCSAAGKVGGTWALLTEEHLVAGLDDNISYDKQTGKRIGNDRYAWFPGLRLIAAPDRSYLLTHRELCAIDRTAYPAVMAQRKKSLEERNILASRVQDLRKKREGASPDAREAIDKQIAELTTQMKALDAKRKKLEDSLLKWRVSCEGSSSVILAGSVLFVGGMDKVSALDAATGKELWTGKVNGKACGLAVSDGSLFVSTDKGTIHCFGKKGVSGARVVKPVVTSQPYPEDELTPFYTAAAESILKATGIRRGYGLVLGCGTGRLAFELAKRTELTIVGIESNEQKVEIARKNLDAAGLYGSCITVDHGSLSKLPYPDYFANLIVSDNVLISGRAVGSSAGLFRVLRPCGGIGFLGQPSRPPGTVPALDSTQLRNWLSESGVGEIAVTHDNGVWARIVRGPLKGAGSWTHLYADPANTACSDDQLVKSPLGVLWFGEPGPQKMVERHARAAAPVSMNGRLFVQGENLVMAYDAYNGCLLWERQIAGAVRVRVDADGSNLAVTDDGLFVAVGAQCLRLDPATGKTLRTYEVPPAPDGTPRRWGYLACSGNLLFGSTARPLGEYGSLWHAMVQQDGTWRPLPGNAPSQMRSVYAGLTSRHPRPDGRAYADFQDMGVMWEPMARFPQWGEVRTPQGALTDRMMTSDSLFLLDADTGKLRWLHRGHRIAHPSISIGGGTIFFAEASVSDEEKTKALREKLTRVEKLKGEEAVKARRELDSVDVRLVVALDAVAGEKRWGKVLDLTGCGGDRLASAYRDGILLFFGAFSNHDRGLFNQGALKWRRVIALSATNGEVLWSRELGYLRRPVLMGDKLIVEPWMCDIHSGELLTRNHPITDEKVPWEFIRGGHSCGITTASPHAFFLRSYSTTYYDMSRDCGMLPFGGIRPGCWINVIAASGLVLYPEASSGCRCSFPIVSTVVLAPREPTEENRPWSIFPRKGPLTPGSGKLTPVKHLAINFGAPGDRMDEKGTLWLGYPRPKLRDLQVEWVLELPLKEQILPGMGYFSRNFKGVRIGGTDKLWVFASGCCGMTRCDVPLLGETDKPAFYTVRMYFCAPNAEQPGQRVFDAKLQGKIVLKNFDIVRSAGATQKAVIKEFKGVPVTRNLLVELVPKLESPTEKQAPIINGIEIIREEA